MAPRNFEYNACHLCAAFWKCDMIQQSDDVTGLLVKLQGGANRELEARLIELVYGELRKLAAYHLRGERPEHSLQPTALVHEAYLRLIQFREVNMHNRSHFFAIAAQLMRRILVDHARAHRAKKRGGTHELLRLEEALVFSGPRSMELVALDEALTRLSHRDPRQSRIVELRFFGGMSEEETGAALGISTRTVKRDWRIAKAWLYKEINSK
jgi:RNA polymerase sigma factor (TIGR02999 family)